MHRPEKVSGVTPYLLVMSLGAATLSWHGVHFRRNVFDCGLFLSHVAWQGICVLCTDANLAKGASFSKKQTLDTESDHADPSRHCGRDLHTIACIR